ncbi:MAG TPA: response regulator transcription factor [Verrucomicrobiae bacterium]|jgi:two-component system alkaline phosphatase synthesis response regulator PhoP|nr:response regulator transcription factor [Verrucomicrobiae bacterium]
MRGNVLFIEDEEALQMTVGDRLRKEGYSVDYAGNGDEGFTKATQLPFDLIILDVMLPKRDGFDVCKGIREAGLITPILMLTARGQTSDKVNGLKIGADDYVTKPFNMLELMARVEALMRRAPIRPAGQAQAGSVDFGLVHVDLVGTEATRGGKPVNLSAREFQLLRYLIERRGATVSREELLKQVWGYAADMFTRTVDVHVASLRQKLEEDPKQPKYILTVQGLGYKLKL